MNDTSGNSWSDFLQNAAGQVLGTGLQVYKAKNVPASIDPNTNRPYVDGQAIAYPVNSGGGNGGMSPMVLLIGAAVVVAVLVLK